MTILHDMTLNESNQPKKEASLGKKEGAAPSRATNWE